MNTFALAIAAAREVLRVRSTSKEARTVLMQLADEAEKANRRLLDCEEEVERLRGKLKAAPKEAAVQLVTYNDAGEELVRTRVTGVDLLAAVVSAVRIGHRSTRDFHVFEGPHEPPKLYWVGRPLASIDRERDSRQQRDMTEDEIRVILEAKLK